MAGNNHKELTPKQKRFCEEYVIDWNATRAYQVAYPDCSYESANTSGPRLLVNVSIKAYVEEIQEDLQKLAGISKLSVLNKLNEIIENEDTETVATRDRLKALEVVNKMLGFNDPDKSEVVTKTKDRSPEEIKAELDHLQKLKEEEEEMFNDD